MRPTDGDPLGGQDIDITLVESPDIGIIGVGEGSTPPLKIFLDFIGVEESDWMSRCDATYKTGITFRNWSTKPGFDEYFHPFQCQPDELVLPAFYHNSFLRRQGVDLDGHPSQFFLGWELAKQRQAPVAPPNFPFKMNYGYHFNSGQLGEFLQEWAEKKGVKYKQATVTEVVLDDKGFIDYLETDSEEIIKADFYVDSTGFRSQLLQQALGVPFESCEEVLLQRFGRRLPDGRRREPRAADDIDGIEVRLGVEDSADVTFRQRLRVQLEIRR